jgi:hypothetical protein
LKLLRVLRDTSNFTSVIVRGCFSPPQPPKMEVLDSSKRSMDVDDAPVDNRCDGGGPFRYALSRAKSRSDSSDASHAEPLHETLSRVIGELTKLDSAELKQACTSITIVDRLRRARALLEEARALSASRARGGDAEAPAAAAAALAAITPGRPRVTPRKTYCGPGSGGSDESSDDDAAASVSSPAAAGSRGGERGGGGGGGGGGGEGGGPAPAVIFQLHAPPRLGFEDVVGNDDAKRALFENVVRPHRHRPRLHTLASASASLSASTLSVVTDASI